MFNSPNILLVNSLESLKWDFVVSIQGKIWAWDLLGAGALNGNVSRVEIVMISSEIHDTYKVITKTDWDQIYQNSVLGLKESEGQAASFPPAGPNNFGQQPQPFGSPGFGHRGGFSGPQQQQQPESPFGFDGGFRGRGRGRGGWRGRGGDFRGQDTGFRGRGGPRGGRGGFAGQGSAR